MTVGIPLKPNCNIVRLYTLTKGLFRNCPMRGEANINGPGGGGLMDTICPWEGGYIPAKCYRLLMKPTKLSGEGVNENKSVCARRLYD